MEEELVREDPKVVQRLERDMKRPDSPRRRARTCSFHVWMLRSMWGIMDWATSSRTKVLMAVTSDSGM